MLSAMRILAFTLLFLISALVYGHNPKLAEAQKLYQAGKYEAALKVINEILAEDASTFEAMLIKGDCLQKEEKFVAAIQMYEQAGKINKESAALLTHHGAALINMKQYREADKLLKKALKIEPQLAEAHYFMGNAKYFQFTNLLALSHYNEALKLNPNYRDALYMRAATHAEMENYRLALRDYEAALAIDPDLHVARYNIAVIYLNDDNYAKSSAMLQEIDPKSLPNQADYYFSLGEALYFDGKREEACKAYESSMILGDEEGKTIYMRYCLNKEEREELMRTRTIRMAF